MNQDDPLAEQILLTVKNDTQSGATELIRNTLSQLAKYADSLRTISSFHGKIRLLSLAERLSFLRPSMAPMQGVLGDWQIKLEDLNTSSNSIFIAQVKDLCRHLIEDINTRQHNQINHAVKLLATTQVILTISRSSVVGEIFKSLPQRPMRFIVCESRPGYEGRTLATDLASADMFVDYIVDAASGLYMPHADAVVVGADAILADGSVVNKCGTSLLAIAAQHFKVPFYVVADSSKCTSLSSDECILEQMPVAELNAPTSPYIHPHNVYFDISPAYVVTAYLTEYGIETQWPWSNIMRPSI
jgi:translation initiation factor eIF-2B subunit delta